MSNRTNWAERASRLVSWQNEIGVLARAGGLEIDDAEASLQYLINELTGGKSVEEFVVQEAVDWPMLAAWVKADEKRHERYKAAFSDRKVLRHERLLDGWWKKAKVEVPSELLTHGDQNKAMENLAKAEGLFKQGEGGVKGTITVTFDDVDARA